MKDSSDGRDWLSTREAAERLGVSEASVRRWSDRGVLPVKRVGRRRERRFKAEHLQGFAPVGAPRPPIVGAPRRPVVGAPAIPEVMVGGHAIEAYTHLATFYDSDAGRLRLTAPFILEGLRAGQPCFLMAHGEVLDSYLERLRHMVGIDLDAAVANGLLRVADGPGATVDEALQFWEQAFWSAMESRAPVMRVVGEMAAVRDGFTSEGEMLAFEAAVNLTIKRFPCIAICQYDARSFSGQALFTALRTHPDLFSRPIGPFLN
jgi:excisionase family DNA binding protein